MENKDTRQNLWGRWGEEGPMRKYIYTYIGNWNRSGIYAGKKI